MENKKTFTQEQVKRAAGFMLKPIVITTTVAEVEFPGSKDAVLREVVRQIQAMLPSEQADTCCCEDHGGQKEACCQETANEGTACVCDMDFGDAIRAVKDGQRVARKGWNGKNQFVELASCISYKGNAGEIVNAHHNAIGNKALAFIGTSGVQMGWLASQADMLAEDWYIV